MLQTPILTLKGHKEAVSGLCWTSSSELVTSSWDHSLRLWDVEVATTLSEIAGNKAFFDVHSSPITSLLLTASSDKYVRMYDPRSTGK
jgi:ribosome biogenesis protein YTM1